MRERPLHSQPDRPDRTARRVLVVEADAALRRVIALGLRRRGFTVIEARTLGELWERERVAPAALVLDVGLGTASEWMLLRALGGHAALRQAPLVLLAWECPAALAPDSAQPGYPRPERVCLTKPFDARALFAAVERVVAAPTLAPTLVPTLASEVAGAGVGLPARAAVVAGGPARDRALRDGPVIAGRQPASPSAWPLVAAGAATLAMAGFLVHPAFAIVGLVVLVAALLWWSTSGAETAPTA